MRLAHKPMTLSRTTLISAGILAALLIGNVFLTYTTFTKPFPGFNDFLTVWQASRSYFYEGLNPYSAETSLKIQTRIYGRAAQPDEQPNHFAYPFYALLFVYPTIHFEYEFGTALWVVWLEVCLVGGLLLLLDLFRWRPRPLTLAGLTLFMLFCYPGARGLVLGQVSHVVFLLQVAALWGLVKERDRLCGVMLALSTFKPQMSILIVPLILLWAISQRRWRILGAFAITMALLVGVSFLMQPDWVSGFWYQLTLYPTYIEVSTPAWVIAQFIGSWAEIALNIAFYAFVAWIWWDLLRNHAGDTSAFLWAAMMTLTVTHLVGLRTASPHFIVFTIPLIFYLYEWQKQRRYGLMVAVSLALLILPWVHFLATIGAAKFEHPTVFLPLPFLTFFALLLSKPDTRIQHSVENIRDQV